MAQTEPQPRSWTTHLDAALDALETDVGNVADAAAVVELVVPYERRRGRVSAAPKL